MIMEYKTGRKNQNSYIEGNVVRKRQAEPAYRPAPQKTREELERSRNIKRAAKRNQQRELSMNLGYVCFLTLATAICFLVCIAFVHVQSDITTRMGTIASLESQISEVKADNAAVSKRLETTMNLDEVKKAAKDMGLVYPGKKQINYYSVKNSDYMNQYGEIPSN